MKISISIDILDTTSSTAVSADSRNNIVRWSEKICQASNQRACRAGIIVESFAT